jgi:hypothetical protein
VISNSDVDAFDSLGQHIKPGAVSNNDRIAKFDSWRDSATEEAAPVEREILAPRSERVRMSDPGAVKLAQNPGNQVEGIFDWLP